MADAPDAWKVLEHGPLVPLAENLRWLSGSIPGMSLKRTMVVVRLQTGQLVIHNGIALDPPTLEELLAFGTPGYLVVPSGIHRLDAPAYKARFPDLRVLCPRGARAKVSQKVPVDLDYSEFPEQPEVWFEPVAGVGDVEGAMLVRSSDGTTLVLNDVMMNMDKKTDFLGWAFTTAMGSAPGPRISRLSKWSLVKDRAALRENLLRWAEIPDLVRVLVAHEKVASGPEAREALKLAATFL